MCHKLIHLLLSALVLEEECRLLNLGREWKYPAWSCQEIADKKLNATSDWYWIKPQGQHDTVFVYCDFDAGPAYWQWRRNWLQVLHFNMSNPQQQCPPNHYRLVKRGGQRLCGRSRGGGCSSLYPAGSGYTYSRVCGSITGYVHNSPDGFIRINCDSCNLNKAYVDGFSVTYGYPREHVWTFAVDWTTTPRCTPPSYVGPNYDCKRLTQHSHGGKTSFCVELPQPTTERLEVRACCDQSLADEDVLLQFAELYVQ